ncbi:FAD-binding oxidoreductase [Oligoflexus tunisiensis]|uniref:FAD-binding oxidoreductase n=1 Tax=Oligoflexus tunisiensis TaxID=708132 RepID=UPI000A6272C5|nr:FAD-binding oxidoreductase [Oligoflexus tunisiensis]
MTAVHLEALKAIVTESRLTVKSDDLQVYGKDWTRSTPDPLAVVFPKTTDEVSRILRYCNEHKIRVVPSGGRTGLAGACNASHQELVVSLEKMNRILGIDPINMSVTAEAGVIIETLQKAAKDAGLFYPVDLAAKGSCQLGGNIATNAGGLKLIRYGGTREQVLGLEVVMADGTVLDLNYDLRKNNIGYDLKQLFVASEGTLGIVTKATMKLAPLPKELRLTCMATDSFEKITQLLGLVNLRGIHPTAFEFFTKACLNLVLKHQTQRQNPFGDRHEFYVLLEFEKQPEGAKDPMEPFLEEAFERGLITDAVIATSSAEFHNLWGLRELISESVSMEGLVRKNDIALPISSLPPFIKEMEKVLANVRGVQMFLFGHIGDGNLHLNYSAPTSMDYEAFRSLTRTTEVEVFKLVEKYRGSISAEHGIGVLKKADLHFCAPKEVVETMRKIKAIFDPNGILNPGKIFDL